MCIRDSSGALHALDQPPELIHCDPGGHLGEDVFARVERGNRLWNVALHRRCDHDGVDVTLEHILENAVGVRDVMGLADLL